MKLLKILILAALAALTAMAFVGASSAMAESTSLCTEDAVLLPGEACPAGKLVSHVHEISPRIIMLSTLKTVECEILYLGDVTSTNNLGNPLEISGHFTYPENANCKTTTGTLCEVKELSPQAVIKVLKLGHELADVTSGYEVNFHCGGFLNCTYNAENLLGHGLGPLLSEPANGEIRLEEQTFHRVGGLLCPAQVSKLDFLTHPLTAIYIAK
jgi:hypothetical protein